MNCLAQVPATFAMAVMHRYRHPRAALERSSCGQSSLTGLARRSLRFG